MANQKELPPGAKDKGDFSHQVDARLKKLFTMTSSEILAGMEAAAERRSKVWKDIDRLAGLLPPRASVEDWRAVKRVQWLRRARLLPNPSP